MSGESARVRASRVEAKLRGWTLVDPARGYWARGAYRIQRAGARGWRWWYVVRLSPDPPRGYEATLLGALDAVDRAI